MAEVIHTRKGKYRYKYDHTREGDKVVSRYMYPVDGAGDRVEPYQKKGVYKISHKFIETETGLKIDMREGDKFTKDPLMGEQIIVIDDKGNELDVWVKETPNMIQLSTIGSSEKGTGIGTKYLLGLKKYADKSGKKLVIPNMTPTGKQYFSRFDWLKDDTVKLEWEEKGKHEEYYPENTMSYMPDKKG